MSRGRSAVWCFFKSVDSVLVQCLLCGVLQSKQGGSTSSMVKHLRSKHPKEFAKKYRGRPPVMSGINRPQDGDTTTVQICSVEVSLDEDNNIIHTTIPEYTETTSAVDGLLVAAGGDAAGQATHREMSNDLPVRRKRHKRSMIWSHYERMDSLKAASCRICLKKLQCFEGGGTSNLWRHLSKRHPDVFAELVPDGLSPISSTKANGNTSTLQDNSGAKQQRYASATPVASSFPSPKAFEGEKQVLRREQELIEALRRTQKEEARALEHQRELLEKLRAADSREAAAERNAIESLRKAQQEEAEELNRQREELQREKMEFQKKWEEFQQEKEELLISRGQLPS